jgi:DNA-binding LacI/PurR family transcriptional regulator
MGVGITMGEIHKKITIKEIAEIAGVSKSTVSRAIDGNPRISDETKSKIFGIINEYGYKPNTAARNLARNKTNAIGIVMPHGESGIYSTSFFQETLKGICNTASDNNYDILITSGNPSEPEAIKRLISTSRVDGIVLLRSSLRDSNVEILLKEKFPFVLIGSCREYKDIYSVDNDNVGAAYSLTGHIVQNGKKRVAFIGGVESSIVTMNRLEGYKKYLNEQGMLVNEQFICQGPFSQEHGYESMKKLMSLSIKPDAVIVMDDSMCIGTMRYLEEKDISIPDDIAIACFNDSSYTKYSRPAVTAVTVDSYQLGSSAAEMLLAVLSNKNVEMGCRYVNYEILQRESTGKNKSI